MTDLAAAARELARSLARLFPSGQDSLWFTLLASLLLSVLWWDFGSPSLPGLQPALSAVAWTVLLLLLVPLVLALFSGLKARSIGLSRGDAKFGTRITVLAAPLVLLVAWLATADPAIRAVYPWTGPGVADSGWLLLVWAGTYALYYLAYEFFFRGYLQGTVERYWGPVPAIWLQTAVTSLVHLGKPFPELLAAIPAGLLFGVVAHRSRSVLWPFLIHLLLGLSTDFFSLLRQGAFQ